MVAQFSKAWQRPPTSREVTGLIDKYVRDEVMYREALKLDLDRDDPMVRRRMAQKLEFLTSDIADLAEPTDKDLNDYLEAHPETFRIEPKFTFLQVFLNPEKRAANIDSDIETLLSSLRKDGESADLSEAGDSILIEQAHVASTLNEIEGQFGQKFVQGLSDLEPGRWQGPVPSGFGVHLVYISEREEGRLRRLDEVREMVERDWRAEKRNESNNAIYEEWRAGYSVTIERPPSLEGGTEE